MTWLPRPTYQERREIVLSRPFSVSSLLLSEFLAEKNVLFFSSGESKLQLIEALAASFPWLDAENTLTDLWRREREGALTVPPDISIVRARVDNLLHVQVAMGICPGGFPDPSNPYGVTRIVILLVGPLDRLRIHLRFLTEISCLFRDKNLSRTILRQRSPQKVLSVLHEAELQAREERGFRRRLERLFTGLFSPRALS